MRMVAGRRLWRGSATLFGAVLLGFFAVLFMASWHASQALLWQDEYDRERGRLWGTACVAAHRAVQAGLVATERLVALAELRQPPAPHRPFLPAGTRTVDEAGVFAARYGAVLADGVPMAVCSLSGSGVAGRWPALRAGAAMAGIDLVGSVGGTGTAMHARLADAQRVLGTLAQGSLFVTGDFGLAHPVERVHRRAVGGRPELSGMDRALSFETGRNMVGVGRASVGAAAADGGSIANAGSGTVQGDVILRSGDPSVPASLSVQAATAVSAAGGFAFGGTQAAFAIPGSLGIGTSMRSRGAVTAAALTLTGDLAAGGTVAATGSVAGRAVSVSGAASAPAGTVSGTLRVDSCSGCSTPPLGP